MKNWYDNCLPTVADVRSSIDKFAQSANEIKKVKQVSVFGSYAENIDNPKQRIKDVNVVVSLPFHSEDLLAVNEDILYTKASYLEEEGYDVEAVTTSKELSKLAEHPIDLWALSNDKKLLHWGPTICSRQEYHDVKEEAEEYASKKSGFNLSKAASTKKRQEWYTSFKRYIDAEISGMPKGWFCSEERPKEVLVHTVKI